MTKLLERPRVETLRERPVELPRHEPRVPGAPVDKKAVSRPKRAVRWMRWMIAVVVVAAVTSLAVVALRDGTNDVTGTSHPLAEAYIATDIG